MKFVKLSLNNFFWTVFCLVASFVPAASASAQELPLFPKYIVMGVVYAPPGASSYVKYSSSSSVGSSDLVGSMNSESTTTSTSTTTGGGIIPIFGAKKTTTNSNQWIEQSQAASEWSVTSTTGNAVSTMGPISSALGVNHDNDVIYIWLNPVSDYTVPTAPDSTGKYPITWNGLSSNGCDLSDPTTSVADIQIAYGCDPNQYPYPDIVGIPVWCLKNPYSPYQGCAQWQQYTSRSWDLSEWDPDPTTGQPTGPGLTLKDYADILRADPFVQLNGQTPNPCHPGYGATLDPNQPDIPTQVTTQDNYAAPRPLSPPQVALWVNAPDMPSSCGTQTPGSKRFQPTGEVEFPVPGPNGLPTTYQGFLQYQSTTDQTYSSTDTHITTYSKSTEKSFGGSFGPGVTAAMAIFATTPAGAALAAGGALGLVAAGAIASMFGFEHTTTHTTEHQMTMQHQTTTSAKTSTGNEADYVITGPQLSDNYTGPSTFTVYQDNIYGTFAFYSPLEPQVTLGTICINSGNVLAKDVDCTHPSSFNWPTAVQVGDPAGGGLLQVTLLNNSIYPLTIAGPAVTFSDPGFKISTIGDHCSNVRLDPGAPIASGLSGFVAPQSSSCTLNIEYKPVHSDAPDSQRNLYASMIAAGTENASMSVSAATSPTTQDILVVSDALVSAIATPDPSDVRNATIVNISDQTSSYTFTSSTLTPQRETFTFTSHYTQGLQLQGGSPDSPVSLSDGQEYSLVKNSNTCTAGKKLSNNEQCQFTVEYWPHHTGSHTARVAVSGLSLVASGPSMPLASATLDGGDPPTFDLTFNSQSVDFAADTCTSNHFGTNGQYCAWATFGPVVEVKYLTLKNNTPGPLSNISLSPAGIGGAAIQLDDPTCPKPPLSLAQNATCQIVVTATIPDDAGNTNDTSYISVSGIYAIPGTSYTTPTTAQALLTMNITNHDDDFYLNHYVIANPTGGDARVVSAGGVAQYQFQIAPAGKVYPGAITFSVDGLPNGAAAQFNPATIAASAGPKAVTLSVQTAKTTTGMLRPPEWMEGGALLCMLLLLPLPTLKRNRRLARLFMLAVTIFAGAAATVSLSGCGGSGTSAAAFNPNASSTYNIVVTIHSGTTSQTMPLQLTIQ